VVDLFQEQATVVQIYGCLQNAFVSQLEHDHAMLQLAGKLGSGISHRGWLA